MKKYLYYSLIKGTSTAHWGAFSRIQTKQSIFVWRILNEILSDKNILLMNQAFNKNIKTEYSWVTKWITSTIINQKHSGSKSMLLAFCTDGDIIWRY